MLAAGEGARGPKSFGRRAGSLVVAAVALAVSVACGGETDSDSPDGQAASTTGGSAATARPLAAQEVCDSLPPAEVAEIFAVPGMTATPMDVRDVIAVCQYRSLGGQPLFSIDLIVRKTYDGMAPRDYWEKMPEIQRAEKERLDAQGVRSGNRSVIEDVQVGDAGRFLTEPGVGGPCGNLQVLAGERIFVVAETGGSPKTVCVTKERAGVLAERLIAQLPK